ncbi:MAG: hypothetical protein KKD05_01495 [Candidatus Omnitrophica bacterium]|nr:hypothetical protein [Candidatus Omnitrophota bacterium]
MFKEKIKYTRDQIYKQLGGNKQIYLPTVKNEVVCACLNPKLNPEAPRIILVGSLSRTRKNADSLCLQEGVIPVFLKRRTKEWEYVGEWKVKGYSSEKADIQGYEKTSGRKGLYKIIFLTKC